MILGLHHVRQEGTYGSQTISRKGVCGLHEAVVGGHVPYLCHNGIHGVTAVWCHGQHD